MPRNYELDHLKSAEQEAFQRKQSAFQRYVAAKDRASKAYDEMDQAWQERSFARDIMNCEFELNQQSWAQYHSIWDEYSRIKKTNNSRIDQLRAEADYEHQAMQDAFNQASSEYEYGDKSMAPYYSEQGHAHKARRNELNDEVSRLCQEVKDAKAHAEYSASRPDETAFKAAKERFKSAKARHESRQAEFKNLKAKRDQAKAEFDSLQAEWVRRKNAFQTKLEQVKAGNKRERENTLDKAGVYWSERENAKIIKKADGTVQVYHGGLGKGDGLSHGHTVLDQFGNKTYKREAFAEHGHQNFTDTQLRNGIYRGTFDGCPAIIKISDAGNSDQMQIFYGGKGSPDGPGHNHVNYVKGKLQFWREHGEILYQDDRGAQINNL